MTKLFFSALLASVSLLASGTDARTSSGFKAQCRNFLYSWRDHNLIALCQTSTGPKTLRINLDTCLRNNEGSLEWVDKGQPGNFATNGCVACYTEKDKFGCRFCYLDDGSATSDQLINLNDGIGFANDQLVCG
ncbi:hypothetical protein DSL72_003649 [Monilinia vaccinii-corymbosi]|uniref:Cyanovirin-N domain-containing protein n=1 Tax=Monilinia vaccinii-corymbosi TaxID=61207 RepID=A0A8A3P698_9HELO|nr:hypothetical protein DSL72_003649 [Monilinia vaccinii-corymbosi]